MMERPIAAERPLAAYAGYLSILAEAQVGPRLRVRVDPADVVQQTLLKAYQRWGCYRGIDEKELRGWLRSILVNVIVDHLRKTVGRDGGARERSLQAAIEESSLGLERLLRDQGSSPSHKVGRSERLLLLADAMGRLPEDQRRAVDLRHLKGQSLEAIAAETGKTVPAVAGLLRRGLQALRADLGDIS